MAMKTRESHTTAVQAKKSAPFFGKEARQGFLQRKTKGEGKSTPFFGRAPGKRGRGVIQTKLTIGAANDAYEKEADKVADQVVQRMREPGSGSERPVAPTPLRSGSVTPMRKAEAIQQKCAHCEQEEKKEEAADGQESTVRRKPIFESEAELPDGAVQRKCAHCEQEEKVQRKGDGSMDASADVESRLSASAGSGSPLPEDTRQQMESSFSADFSGVRIHSGSSDAQLSKDIGAQAFTHGSDIYFNSGNYNTSTAAGKHLLAHELTHVVQQSGQSGATPLKRKRIQRLGDYYWRAIGAYRDYEHTQIFNNVKGANVVTDAPIPNAQRDKLGHGADFGEGKFGYADFYQSNDPQTTMGVYFFREGLPSKLPPKGMKKGKQDGKSFAGEVAPVVDLDLDKQGKYNKLTDRIKVGKVDQAPKTIALGELKSINPEEGELGEKQLSAYKEGIKYCADGISKMPGLPQWDPKIRYLTTDELEKLVPEQFQPNSAKPFEKNIALNEHLVLNLEDKSQAAMRKSHGEMIKGKLVAIPDHARPGILTYAWVPSNPVALEALPYKIQDLGDKITQKIIDPLKASGVVEKDDGKGVIREKALPRGAGATEGAVGATAAEDTASAAGATGTAEGERVAAGQGGPKMVDRVAPKRIQREKEFDLPQWKKDKNDIQDEYSKLKNKDDFQKTLATDHRIKAAKLIEQHMGIHTMDPTQKELDTGTYADRIRFWANPLTKVFGPFKKLLGGVFSVIVKGYNKLKGWVQSLIRKLNFGSTKSGLAASAIKAVFNIVKVAARIVISKVVELFKQDIYKAIEQKIAKLIEASGVEDAIAYIKEKTAPLQEIVDSFEKKIEDVKSEYQAYFNAVNHVISVMNEIDDIVSLVRWGARVIECLSPPAVGCLWMLAQSALEKAAAYVVETCWFRKKIAPLVLKLDIVQKLAQEIYNKLKTFLKTHLRDSILEFIFPEEESQAPPSPTKDDITCGSGGGGGDDGEPGGGELTPEQQAVMQMQEDLGEEKFQALLELLQKANVDPKTKMSADHVKQLAEAVKGLSADQLKKMADAYVKGDPDGVPEDIKKAIEKLAGDPKGTAAVPPPPDLDAAKKEEAVAQAEAQKDAAEAAKDSGAPPPSAADVRASRDLAQTVLDYLINVQRLVYVDKKGRLVLNEVLSRKLDGGQNHVLLPDLQAEIEVTDLETRLRDVQHDQKTVQQINILLKIHVLNSDNPMIAPGEYSEVHSIILWDPVSQTGVPLQKPTAVQDILLAIGKGQIGIMGKVYSFAELGFAARLDNIKKDEVAGAVELYFCVTRIDQPEPSGIFDNIQGKYISLSVGCAFMLREKAPGDQSVPIAPAGAIRRKTLAGSDILQRLTETELNDRGSAVYHDLKGWTSSADSADILQKFNGQPKREVDAILNRVALANSSSVAEIYDWLRSDMVTSDWKALLALFVQVRSEDLELLISSVVAGLLKGLWVSEDDSREIENYLSGLSGGDLDNVLTQLEVKMGKAPADMAFTLFDSMEATHAFELSKDFFGSSGAKGADYASSWIAQKVFNLLKGYTSIRDSHSIVQNFQRTPEAQKGMTISARTLVLYKLGPLCQERWGKTAEDALMTYLQQEDYEELNKMMPNDLKPYSIEKNFFSRGWDKIKNGYDYLQGWLVEYPVCGIIGVVAGIFDAVKGIVGSIIDLAYGIKNIVGWLISKASGGRFCRECEENVHNFMDSMGQFFHAPGEMLGKMWDQTKLEASMIEGPFEECQLAIFWVRRVANIVVNILLIIVAGYGAVKAALEAIDALAEISSLGELLSKLGKVPIALLRRMKTAVVSLPAKVAEIVTTLRDFDTIASGVRSTIGVIRAAATDEKFYEFLRSRAVKALKTKIETEKAFWEKRKAPWNKTAEIEERNVSKAEDLADTATKTADTDPGAAKQQADLATEQAQESKANTDRIEQEIETGETVNDAASGKGSGTLPPDAAMPAETKAWLDSLSAETKALLESDPELKRFWTEMDPEVRQALTFCNTPCIPPNVSPDNIAAIKQLIKRLKLPAEHRGLREYLHIYRNDQGDLANAIKALDGVSSQKELEDFLDNELIKTIKAKNGVNIDKNKDGLWQYHRESDIVTEYEIGSHGDLTANRGTDNFFQSHHGIQDAWARERFKGLQIAGESAYDREKAQTILLRSRNLEGGSRGTPHGLFTDLQNARRDTIATRTFAEERDAMIKDLKDIGVPAQTRSAYLDAVDDYFGRIYNGLKGTLSKKELEDLFGTWKP